MLSIKALGKAGVKDKQGRNGLDYLKSTEYYTNEKGESVSPAEWVGKAANGLGLTGKVDYGNLDQLALGFGPDGGPLVKGAGDHHRIGHDLTFSADKSVSIAFAFADDETKALILAAHQKAVDKALGYLEKHAITRVGTDGVDRQSVDGLVAARFQHFASRELDPQLHSHCLVLNLAKRADGKWGTLESKTFYNHKMAAGAAYRSELARNLSELGFGVERDERDGFRLSGVSQADIDTFSTRRAQILEALKKFGGRSAKAAEKASLSSRKEKEEPPYDELINAWREQGMQTGWDAARVTDLASGKHPARTAEPDIDAILARMTEQRSTFLERDLLKHILVETVGNWDLEKCEKTTAALLADKRIIRLGFDRDGNERVTTVEMFELEKGVVEAMSKRLDETSHRVSEHEIGAFVRAEETRITKAVQAKDPSAAPVVFTEQREAIKHICCDTGGTAFVEGWAGTGKTTMLKVVNDVYAAKGFRTVGCALSGKAAEGLQTEAGIASQTLFSLLDQLDKGTRVLDKQDVVVLDEAGMVGSRMFARLQAHVDKGGAKLVVVGDPKQLQAIDAGGMMATLMKRAGRAELSDIQRQRDDENGSRKFKWLRDTVKRFATGEATLALDEMDRKGALELSDTQDGAISKIAAEYMADPTPMKEKLIVAASRAEVFKLNQEVRGLMTEAGALSGEPVTVKLGDGAWREFQTGDRILFTRNNLRLWVKNGTLGEVLSVSHNPEKGSAKFTVRTDGGRVVEFDTSKYKAIDHGFAVTCHKSQGVTVDQSYVLVSESMSNREWTYVAASRTRYQTRMFAVEQDVAEELATLREQRKEKIGKAYHTEADERQAQLGALGKKMSQSGAKDTSQDYGDIPELPESAMEPHAVPKTAVPAVEAARTPARGHFKPGKTRTPVLAKAQEQVEEKKPGLSVLRKPAAGRFKPGGRDFAAVSQAADEKERIIDSRRAKQEKRRRMKRERGAALTLQRER